MRQLCRVTKGMDERIDKGVWFDHIERMENDRIDKMVYVRECEGRPSVDQPRKRCIDSARDCV